MADAADNLNLLAKEVFGDAGVPDLIPNGTKLQQRVKFSQKDMLGLKYVQTVRLAYPSGFTHAKGDGTAGAFSFQDVVGGSYARAELSASQVLLRDWLSYEDAAKLSSNKQAFKEGVSFFLEGMQKAVRKRLEIQLMYGSKGLGQTASSVNSDTTHTVVTLTDASFASGIWSGQEGTKLNFYTAVPALVSSSANAVFVIDEVDLENKALTISGTTTGISALDAAISGGTCSLWYAGAYGNEMLGLHGILSTDSKFGIDGGVYNLWKSTAYALPSPAALSFAAIKKAVSKAVAKGLDADCSVFCSPEAWDDLATDIASLRVTDKSEVKKVEIGAEEIVFHSQAGKIEIVPSMYVKGGVAFGMQPDMFKRIGARDASFDAPGMGGKLFLHLPSNGGVEYRNYAHQALWCEMPGPQFVITNIVNST